ncbi:PREDICTED: uncharacterized protein LOC104772005 [Camelina sativa]|uniref:Uncharacterized protein LOC104772005 n=1 Tax=Camelina sativa TaxID=90675 RepID=A0ABM0Y3P7_CAMSA|nr:PREDICTED: uncharacterized protein LOC104772005 [Camelina sativa]XP_010494947.1 PREDICTED: uncharacterized protein LOC104772005 [Camelina sativa]
MEKSETGEHPSSQQEAQPFSIEAVNKVKKVQRFLRSHCLETLLSIHDPNKFSPDHLDEIRVAVYPSPVTMVVNLFAGKHSSNPIHGLQQSIDRLNKRLVPIEQEEKVYREKAAMHFDTAKQHYRDK